MEICARSLLTHEPLVHVRFPATASVQAVRQLLSAKLHTPRQYLELLSETGEELQSISSGEVFVSRRPPAEDALLHFLRDKVMSSRYRIGERKDAESPLDIQHVAYLLESVDPNRQDGHWSPYGIPTEGNGCLGCTALHYAVLAALPRCAELILQHGDFSSLRVRCRMSSFLWPGPDYMDEIAEDVEALHCVALVRDAEGPALLRLLLACPQIDPDAKTRNHILGLHSQLPRQDTLLTLAAKLRRKDLLQALLKERRVDFDARDSAGHKVLRQLAQIADELVIMGMSCEHTLLCALLVHASGRCEDHQGRSLLLSLIDERDGEVDGVAISAANAKVDKDLDRQRNQRRRRRERYQCVVKKMQRPSRNRQPDFASTLRRTPRKGSRGHIKQGWVDASDVCASCELVLESHAC
eukprot:TRINITY_DN2068_c0_g1_i5.p1 TRINITY_DN2068_c0_g1~~TRINITY_DN2068_c0_g1_i5.p1  ORF type:complete len:436 (+),score=59.17 TRINITY_DN2068_c0_g1_i5:78-1310(+)